MQMQSVTRALSVLNFVYRERWYYTNIPYFVKPNTFLPPGLWKEPRKSDIFNDEILMSWKSSIANFQKLGFSDAEIPIILSSIDCVHISLDKWPILFIPCENYRSKNYEIIKLLESKQPPF